MQFFAEFVVRFAHVDAAGIVFYPRYGEMLNETVERWFGEALGLPFQDLIRQGRGIPMRRMSVEFIKPSYLKDRLRFSLASVKIGTSSINLDIRCTCGSEDRLTAKLTIVYADLRSLSATPVPEDLRNRMLEFGETAG